MNLGLDELMIVIPARRQRPPRGSRREAAASTRSAAGRGMRPARRRSVSPSRRPNFFLAMTARLRADVGRSHQEGYGEGVRNSEKLHWPLTRFVVTEQNGGATVPTFPPKWPNATRAHPAILRRRGRTRRSRDQRRRRAPAD